MADYPSIHTGVGIDAGISEIANIADIRQEIDGNRVLAQSAATTATNQAGLASASKTGADDAQIAAEAARDIAVTKAGDANDSATAAGLAETGAEAARDLAETYRDQALVYRNQASQIAAGDLIDDVNPSDAMTYSSEKIEQILSSSGALTSQVIAAAGASLTLTGASVGLFHITLTTANCNLSVSIPTVAPELRIITLVLKQGSGANEVTWDSAITWQNGRPPILAYDIDVVDIVRLVSDPTNSGEWFGIFDGAWFS